MFWKKLNNFNFMPYQTYRITLNIAIFSTQVYFIHFKLYSKMQILMKCNNFYCAKYSTMNKFSVKLIIPCPIQTCYTSMDNISRICLNNLKAKGFLPATKSIRLAILANSINWLKINCNCRQSNFNLMICLVCIQHLFR